MAKTSKEIRMEIMIMAKNMNPRVMTKELVMQRCIISEIYMSESTGCVLNQPNYGLYRNLQHWIILGLIKIRKNSVEKKNKKTDGQLMHESDRFNLLPVDNTKRFVSTKKPSLNKKYLKVKCVMKCGIISHSVTKRIWS